MRFGWPRNSTFRGGFQGTDRSARDTARAAVLYGAIVPISGQAHSGMKPLQEKRTLPGLRRRPPLRLRCRTWPKGPISVSRTEFSYLLGPTDHVQLLFTWNPSPLQSSKFSFEYLLLPPRSAPGRLHQNRFPGFHAHPSGPPTRLSLSSDSIAETARYRSDALAPSIFRAG
ncbi:hypothetical protein BgiBS90_038154 [Biomphalaria glabrata]|nr:hypothetical protein BgiBS90_038154 [Biomphalaria glabrata]